MKTLVRHSPRLVTADRLHQETGLLARAAQKVRERGRTGDEELARRLEHSILGLWAGAPDEAELLTVLADVLAA
jgi:hypothetical protein